MLLLLIKTCMGADCNPVCSFQEGQALAELLTPGWTLSSAPLCYELRSLKKFISLDLHPVYFLVEAPSSHQLPSQGAKAIRQQWKRNTIVFTFNSLGLMPWTSYGICPEDGYKKHERLTKEQSPTFRVLALLTAELITWLAPWKKISPGSPCGTSLVWGSLSWARAGAAAKLHQSQIYTRRWRSYEAPLTQKLMFLWAAGLSAHCLWRKGKKTPDQCMLMN